LWELFDGREKKIRLTPGGSGSNQSKQKIMRTRTHWVSLAVVMLACVGVVRGVEIYSFSPAGGASGHIPSAGEASSGTWFWTDDGIHNWFYEPATMPRLYSDPGEENWQGELGFLSLDLRDGGELQTGQMFTDGVLSADFAMHWGEDIARQLGYALRVEDDSGNGYMGEVRRNGDLYLYRLDDGTEYLLDSKTNGVAGNQRSAKLSVVNGEVSLTDSLDEENPLTASDATHSRFTKIGVGARVTDTEATVYHVNLSGTIVP